HTICQKRETTVDNSEYHRIGMHPHAHGRWGSPVTDGFRQCIVNGKRGKCGQWLFLESCCCCLIHKTKRSVLNDFIEIMHVVLLWSKRCISSGIFSEIRFNPVRLCLFSVFLCISIIYYI